jgi:hypothetical protein
MPARKECEAKPIWTTKEVEEEVSEKSLRNGENHGFLVPAKVLPGAPGGFGPGTNAKKIVSGGNSGILLGSREAEFKFRFNCAGAPRFSMVEQRIRFVRCGWRENMLSEGNNERFASRVL